MKNLFFLPLLLLFLLTTSCSTYKLEGSTSVPELNGRKLYIRIPGEGAWIDLDSCEVVHGFFKMNGEVDSVMLTTLCLGMDGLMPLVLERGNIQVSIENTGLQVSGTPLNEKLYDFIARKNELESDLAEVQRKERLMVMDGIPESDIKSQTEPLLKNLVDEMNNLIADFVISNFDNVLSLGVFATLCSNYQYPVITPYIEKIMQKAPDSFKEDAFVKEYMRLAVEYAE